MKKKRFLYPCLIAAVLLLAGCGKGKEPDVTGPYLYYVNAEGTNLVKEAYSLKGDTPEDEISSVLKDMQKEPEDIECRSPFTDQVRIESAELLKGKLTIRFGEEYTEMDATSEALFRAALVKTMVQIAGVDYVDFLIGDAPLTNNEGEQVGFMRAEDFVQNTGSSLHSYQIANLQLFFANKKGDRLAREEVSVRYNSNMSIERLIVEQLIKGPGIQDHQPTVSPETKVLGVSVKDGICYVNFDENFMNNALTLDPQISIYSLVNSIIEGGTASQVQISVNGETNVMYQEMVDLGKPFSLNLDIMEEVKE